MRFSKKSEYALRALIELTKAYGGTPGRRHQIAERENIPIVFLEEILLALKHAGLLASARGAQGGYVLIKPPAKGTLGQGIRILCGPLAPIGCVSKTAYKKCREDRKSTRLNSSHSQISYAVFCLKKKKN